MSTLKRRVLGYHFGNYPALIPSYRFDLLSTIGYCGYSVNPKDGTAANNLSGWGSTDLIAEAHASGTKVVLVAQLFGTDKTTAFLASPASRTTFVKTILHAVQSRGGDGVQLDFEEVPASQRANLKALLVDLATAFKDAIPGASISAALPALGHTAFDLEAFATLCSDVVVMAYDYAWAAAPDAGPVAPLAGGGANVTATVTRYLAENFPKDRLLLGVPFYGFDWPTVDTKPHSAREKGFLATAYGYNHNVAKAKQFGRHWDPTAATPYYAYVDGAQSHVVWYEDEQSLAAKYGLVNTKDLGGIGIWNLYWSDGAAPLWSAIQTAFT